MSFTLMLSVYKKVSTNGALGKSLKTQTSYPSKKLKFSPNLGNCFIYIRYQSKSVPYHTFCSTNAQSRKFIFDVEQLKTDRNRESRLHNTVLFNPDLQFETVFVRIRRHLRDFYMHQLETSCSSWWLVNDWAIVPIANFGNLLANVRTEFSLKRHGASSSHHIELH